MNEQQPEDLLFAHRTYSLQSILITTFLLLALAPLIFVSWQAHTQAKHNLRQNAILDLSTTSELTELSVTAWIDIQMSQAKYHADSPEPVALLQAWQNNDSEQNRQHIRHTLNTHIERHHNYKDAFIVNRQLQVLSSSGLDSGLNDFFNKLRSQVIDRHAALSFDPKHAFLKADRFSDFTPDILGVIYIPMLSSTGEWLGGYGVRLNLHQMYKQLAITSSQNRSLQHYLVEADTLLLVSPVDHRWDDVLKRHISTYGTNKKITRGKSHPTTEEYLGPSKKIVMGQQRYIDHPLVNWILVSEVDTEDIGRPSEFLARFTIGLIFATILFVIFAAVFLAKGITRPLKLLSDIANQASHGEFTKPTKELNVSSEISDLYDAFTNMLSVREAYEKTIEEGKKQLEMVLESTDVGLWDWHMQTADTEVNDQWARMLGYELEEIAPVTVETWIRLAHPKDMEKSNAILKAHFAGQEERYECEMRMRHKQGHWVWVLVTGKVFEYRENGKPSRMIGTHLDISHTKYREHELILAKEIAEDAAKSKSEFLACMSHEIRTPMNGVLGMLRLLEKSPLQPKQKYQINTAQKSANGLLNIIDDILDFSKIEAGKLELEQTPTLIGPLVREVVDSIHSLAEEKNIAIQCDFDRSQHPSVLCDQTRIKQILYNLLSNAIKFTERGKISVTCWDEMQTDNLIFYCKISDTGIGIPESKLANLFDAFHQVDASTTRKFGGTGLGLAIVKNLCQLMGGDIQVQSEEGTGSEFCFHLTLKPASVESVDNTQPIGDSVIPLWPQGTLALMVEDNEINQEVALGMLEDLKLTTDIAENGEHALEKLNDPFKRYSVILMDCQMPIMDGYQATIAIREGKAGNRYKDIPIIAMTANAMKGDREKCLSVGMSDYLSKPIDPELLTSSLTRCLLNEPVDVSGHETISKSKDLLWDQEALAKRLKYRKDRIILVTNMVIEEKNEILSYIDEYTNSQDFHNLKILAHAQKGVFSNLNAYLAESAADMLYQKCLQDDLDDIHAAAVYFKTVYQQTLNAFEKARRENKTIDMG